MATAGCCGDSSDGSGGRSSSFEAAFPSLNAQFGGSEKPRTGRFTHVGSQTATVKFESQSFQMSGNSTKYAPLGGAGESQHLPGEASVAEIDANQGEVKFEDSLQCLPVGSIAGCNAMSAAVQAPIETTTNQFRPRFYDIQSPNPTTASLPRPAAPPGPGDPPVLPQSDVEDFNGVALQVDPGGATGTVVNGQATAAVDIPPKIMVAVSLGATAEGRVAAGYLVPDPDRTVGPEEINYYKFRIPHTGSYAEFHASDTGDLRWTSQNLLIILD